MVMAEGAFGTSPGDLIDRLVEVDENEVGEAVDFDITHFYFFHLHIYTRFIFASAMIRVLLESDLQPARQVRLLFSSICRY